MKVLYVPNEHDTFRQVGLRRAFADLQRIGIAEVSVFSLELRIRDTGDSSAVREELISRVRSFRPDVVLLQHVGVTGLDSRDFARMRQSHEFSLIYHEGDPYSRWLHPLPRAARAAGRAADVVFTVGAGVFIDNFLRAGANDVRWAPWVFGVEQFPRVPPISDERKYDVVVVANRNTPRLRGLPDWRQRIEFVERVQDRFGSRAAIFGRGWRGANAMGPVAFSRQHCAIRSGWISANWDHYANEPKYFSDRLPISLAAGSIHATTLHPGYEQIFGPGTSDYLIFGRNPSELIDAIELRLSQTSHADRVTATQRSQEYAYANFRQDDQLLEMLNFDRIRVEPEFARSNWDSATQPLDEV